MKRRYFKLKDFITFLNLLEENKVTELWIEGDEEYGSDKYTFMKIYFNKEPIILYAYIFGPAGIIQDTPADTWDKYAECVYEELTAEEEYRIFIEEK